jgi:hypothetical protein
MLSSAFIKVQFVRLSTMVKPFWFVLCAYFAVAVLKYGKRLTLTANGSGTGQAGEGAASESRAISAVLAGTVTLLTLPVLVPATQAFWARHVRKTMVVESTRPLHDDRAALVPWLMQNLPKDGFYRVGVFMGHNHELLDLGTLIDHPVFKRGFTPANNFIYQMQDRDPAILDSVNLRFAISKQFLPPEDFEPVASFGHYTVYRYRRWQPNPFEILEGEGDVKLERFEDEEIALRAAPGSHGKLRLNVSYFSRWHVYRDGKPVPLTLTYLREAPQQTGYMTVPLAPGEYRFVFERTLGDRLSLPLGLLGLVLCALFIAADRRQERLVALKHALAAIEGRLDALSEPRFRGLRLVSLGVFGVGVLTVAIVLGVWRPKLELQELGPIHVTRVRYDFLENVRRASANIQYREKTQPCLN